MSKHTPGPWYWDFDRDGLASLRSDHGDEGPVMIDVNCYPVLADRCLIAAAPDLLEALEAILRIPGAAMHPEYYDAVTAIARAKGESS